MDNNLNIGATRKHLKNFEDAVFEVGMRFMREHVRDVVLRGQPSLGWISAPIPGVRCLPPQGSRRNHSIVHRCHKHRVRKHMRSFEF